MFKYFQIFENNDIVRKYITFFPFFGNSIKIFKQSVLDLCVLVDSKIFFLFFSLLWTLLFAIDPDKLLFHVVVNKRFSEVKSFSFTLCLPLSSVAFSSVLLHCWLPYCLRHWFNFKKKWEEWMERREIVVFCCICHEELIRKGSCASFCHHTIEAWSTWKTQVAIRCMSVFLCSPCRNYIF